MSNQQQDQQFNVLQPSESDAPPYPGNDGARYYTVQRVNGNGANGKGDGTAGSHKHTIEDSDNVKKSSIHRHFLREQKERKRSMVSNIYLVLASWSPAFKAALHYFHLHRAQIRGSSSSSFRDEGQTSSSEYIHILNAYHSFSIAETVRYQTLILLYGQIEPSQDV